MHVCAYAPLWPDELLNQKARNGSFTVMAFWLWRSGVVQVSANVHFLKIKAGRYSPCIVYQHGKLNIVSCIGKCHQLTLAGNHRNKTRNWKKLGKTGLLRFSSFSFALPTLMRSDSLYFLHLDKIPKLESVSIHSILEGSLLNSPNQDRAACNGLRPGGTGS